MRTIVRLTLPLAVLTAAFAGAWALTTMYDVGPASDHVNQPATTISVVLIGAQPVGLIPPATAMASTGLIPPACADHTGPIDCGGGGMNELTLANFSTKDRYMMRQMLDFLIANDLPTEEKVELRQGGFTLWVKTEGKPGVAAMDRLCQTYTESPGLLCHLLRKLLSDNTGTETSES